jgi:hypothetical protein
VRQQRIRFAPALRSRAMSVHQRTNVKKLHASTVN